MPKTAPQTLPIPLIWQGWNVVNIARVAEMFVDAPVNLERWDLAAIANIEID
jgi:hypothetical protein